MDRINDLALFLRVLDLGSISAAARSLGLSPAVGSQRLKRLERDLGARLLHRTTRQVHATPEGKLFAEQGRAMVEDLETLFCRMRQTLAHVAGPLRLTMPSTFGREYISPLLPAFLERYPEVELHVDTTDQMVDIVASGYDLAIRIGMLEDSSLVARKLANNQRILCASPAYIERHGRPETPVDLNHHQCLRLTGSQRQQDVWRLIDENGTTHAVKVTGRVQSNQGELLRDAAVAGLGIAQHSVWHIADDLRTGRLEPVLPEYAIAETGIYAVMPQRKLVPERVRAFVAFIEQHLSDEPWALSRIRQGP
ncbi:LysR family transcriptional regulator [Marinobacter sp. 71-i]|uniref:LysR family transcriptional regulator n=1 Tax=Marinobacter iranensis TaxID=2962607 RepID=A0ABT5YBV5_9GAMM|nr:LysR family transcriptional regulator [Marinobacter iranensis]MDF0751092.1 LysR family transcriptional regulator [Marinobacter iranensis]